jgi:SpoVK/Ycf46/Vps4 family AAA+-type ATPase
MARADLITDLVATGMAGDRTKFRKVVEALIAEERAKNHLVLAESLQGLLTVSRTESSRPNGAGVLDPKVDAFVLDLVPVKRLEDLILPPDVLMVITELISEHHRVDLLRSYNLEPRNRLLFIGPPGNGKTSLAEAVAEALMVPLLQVRYDGIVGAYLGETANRLRRLLEFASTRKCVLFFDEFETLGKERGDTHETGEIKRVVSSLLMQVDALPSHVVVIGATNHPELLDRAVWRRFQVRVELPAPTRSSLAEWFARFERRINQPLGYSPDTLATRLAEASFAEAEEFGTSVFRKFVLGQPESEIKRIVAETMKTWKARSAKSAQANGGDQ